MWGGGVPLPPGEASVGERAHFLLCDLEWYILLHSQVLNLKFFFIVSSVGGGRVDSVANFGFLSNPINKRHIYSHWARATNIGVLYPKVRNNIGGYSH